MRSTPQELPGLHTVEHELEVPLDPARPDGPRLTVFAREVCRPRRRHDDLPWMLFLQGGPGFPAPRPSDASGWIGRVTEEYRLLLLDQRGTGRSSPVTHETLASLEGARAQADHLAHFRADAIVRDAEAFRRELLAPGERWTLLGQSFGGFCALHYLSAHPEALEAALITGGLPSLDAPVDEVYRRTFAKLAEKNAAYYRRYPRDVERAREIAALLDAGDVRLPCGDRLTRRRFQSIGIGHGSSAGFEALHHLLEAAFVDGPGGRQLAYAFLNGVESMTSYDTNPIYALLHEAIYMQGAASRWSADRVRTEFPAFDDPEGPLLFTAEMIHPWMFEDWSVLRPLAPAAELLAAREDWPALYDPTRLEANEVPVAAAVYHDDAYVPVDLSLDTASRVGRLRAWVTSEYEHDGLRVDGPRILGRLLGLARGELAR
jgi:pimeloyl-ACP methyl ester carboxylesterase